jgi:phage baseplate assembly protein gpV
MDWRWLVSFLPIDRVVSQALRASKIRGVQLAIVVDNKDGVDNPGYRVKVKFPWLSEQETSFWARIAVPMGGAGRGTYVLPEIDDQVLVVFEHGDINRPVVIGSVWNKKQEPVEVNQSGQNNTKLIKSRSGHRIIFDDKEGAEKITIVDKTKKNKIVLDSVNKVVKLESDGDIEVIAKANVVMHSNALKIGTSEGVTGKGQSLLVHAQKTFGLKATSGITIGGGSTTINVSNGAATSVSGSGAGELGGAAGEASKEQSSSGTAASSSSVLAAVVMNEPALSKADVAAQPSTAPAQKVKPVNPIVAPASLVVVVPKQAKHPTSGKVESYTKPKRQAITLKTDAAFDGTATITCDKLDRVKLFSAATGGREIKFDGTDNVFKPSTHPAWTTTPIAAGVKVFAEAVRPSDAVDDIAVKLALSGGSKPTGPDAKATITSVELTLDICKSRPAGGGDPPPLSQYEKVHIGRSVLVQNKVQSFERAKLIIQQAKPKTFKGTLVVKAKNEHVAAYKDEKPKAGDAAVQFQIAADKVAATGKIIWAQAERPSDDMRDSGFTLGIKDVDDEGDKVTATAVKIQLDICQSRTAKDAVPKPLSEGDKLNIGRFIHEQDAGNHHGRAQLVVRKILPKKFTGTLTLAGSNANKVEIFPNELVTDGEASTTLPHDFDYDPKEATKKNEDKKLWVQGKSGGVSHALRDVVLSLRIKEDNPTSADTVRMTVVRFSTLKADVPSTPALNPRAGNSPVNRHEWKIADPTPTKDHFSEDIDVNKPIVLIENSVRAINQIKLSVKVAPAGVPVNWAIIRDRRLDKGDHKDIVALTGNKEAPTLGSNASGLVNTLIADAVGSFHICPFVDCNGSKKLDFMTHDGNRIDREPFIMMNLVLVRVQGVSNDSKGQPNNCTPVPAAGQTAANFGSFTTGGWNGADSGWYAKATVDVIGGGSDGLRGLKYVFGGWIQHIFLNNISVSYLIPAPAPIPPALPPPPPAAPPLRHHRYAFVSNLKDATHSGKYHYIGATEAPISAADAIFVIKTEPTIDNRPILDVSPYSDAGTGGDSAVGTARKEGGLPPPRTGGGPHGGGYPAPTARPLGQRWVREMWDSPGIGCRRSHISAGGTLASFRFNLGFRTDLCFWTSTDLKPDATANGVANRLYSSVYKCTWKPDFEIKFHPVTGAGTITIAKKIDVTKKNSAPNGCAVAVEGFDLETRHPYALGWYAVDART